MNLSENIYRLRTEKNMSQGDLADALDVSRQSVSKWENGTATPELEKLMKMSELFGVTLDELVNSPSPNAEPEQKADHQSGTPVSTRKIVGILLIACGLVSLFVPGGMLSVFLFGVPLAVTGAVLAFAEADWLFRTCWLLLAAYFPVFCIFGLNFTRLDFALATIGILLLLLVTMILWSILGFKREKLSPPSKKIALICVVWIVLTSVLFYVLLKVSTPELKSTSTEVQAAEVIEFEEASE